MSDEKQELAPHEWFGLTPQGVSDAVSDYILAKHFPEDDEIDAVVHFDRRHGATIEVTHRRLGTATLTDEERAERALLAEMPGVAEERNRANRIGYVTFDHSTDEVCEAFIAGYLAARKERGK